MRATKDKVRSSNRETRKAAHGQRISAARHDLTAARMNINSEKMQANLDIVRTGISLQWQTYEALSSMVQGQMLVARQKRVNARRTAYASVHMNRLRDGLALFPLSWRKGDGWMLIDLKSGRWAEVATAVKEARLGEDVFVNAPAIALSAGTGMFYSKGIHLDPSTWRPDGRYVYGKTVRRALMGYQLKNLKFRSPKSYPSKSFTLTKREKRRILGETK